MHLRHHRRGNILLNVILIPRFGYIAAAWSTVAGYVLLLLIVALVATRSVSMGFNFRPCFRMAGSALLMGLLLYTIRDTFASAWLNLGFCLLAGVSAYVIALIFTREVDAGDVSAAFRGFLFRFKTIVNGRKAPRGYSL